MIILILTIPKAITMRGIHISEVMHYPINRLETYLNTHSNLSASHLQYLMAYAIYLKSNPRISMLNLYIREYRLKITKKGILHYIYEIECNEDLYQSILHDIDVTFLPFDSVIEQYEERFGHLM